MLRLIQKRLTPNSDKSKDLPSKKFPIPWGIISTSFINKCGNMGLLVIPMLLIEKNISTMDSTWVMGTIKGSVPLTSFFSGYILEKWGAAAVLRAAFLLSSVAFCLIGFVFSPLLIALLGSCCAMASGLFNPSSRDLIKSISGSENLRISNSYLRSASNLGQVVSSVFGMLAGQFGLIVLFLFDSVTSLIAFILSFKIIPNPKQQPAHKDEDKGGVHRGFYRHTTLVAIYLFIYELSLMTFSALSKIHLGEKGVQGLALVLLINTLLCGIMAVPAAHWFRNPKFCIPVGLVMTVAAPIVFLFLPKNYWAISMAAFLLTFGEIFIAVFSQTLLLQNSHGKWGRIHYGRGLTLQHGGIFLAGIFLFPFVVNGTSPQIIFLTAGSIGLLLFYFIPNDFLFPNSD